MTFEPTASEFSAADTGPRARKIQEERSSGAFRLKAEATKPRTDFQESFKYEGMEPRTRTDREVPYDRT
jgi:hypothetical protein